jgi:hypothetical protein
MYFGGCVKEKRRVTPGACLRVVMRPCGIVARPRSFLMGGGQGSALLGPTAVNVRDLMAMTVSRTPAVRVVAASGLTAGLPGNIPKTAQYLDLRCKRLRVEDRCRGNTGTQGASLASHPEQAFLLPSDRTRPRPRTGSLEVVEGTVPAGLFEKRRCEVYLPGGSRTKSNRLDVCDLHALYRLGGGVLPHKR